MFTNDGVRDASRLTVSRLQNKRFSAVERQHLCKRHLVEATEHFSRAAPKKTMNDSKHMCRVLFNATVHYQWVDIHSEKTFCLYV